jgi:hypothetical protein
MSTSIAALSSNSIRYAEFIQINIGTIGSPTATYSFCNAASNVTVNGITFEGMGAYVGLGEIQQDMKSTSVDLKVTITGLDPNIIAAVLAANMKGSQIIVWRGFLDSNNQIETIGGVQQFFQRYQGIINNIAIAEKFDQKARIRIATCVISSASMRLVLDARIAGIKTNPSSWRFLYPNDTSMDRVPVIASTYFNFGTQPTNGSASKVIGSTSSNPVPLVSFGSTQNN